MPADKESKTEAPTPKRRTEARNKGNIPRSQDLTAAVTLLFSMLALRYLGESLWYTWLAGVRFFLGDGDDYTIRAVDAQALAPMAGLMAFQSLAPFLVVIFGASLIISWAQVGWFFSLNPMQPSLSKLNPVNGFKRLFSARKAIETLINLGKMIAVLIVVWVTIDEQFPLILDAMRIAEVSIIAHGAGLCYTLGIRLAIVLLVLGIIDYVYRRYKQEQDLKMTKQEVKDEMRSMEGDPQIKRRRRELQIQQSLQRINASVPKADVVVTNPTEFAVAIEYDVENMHAPTVVAKGRDMLARRIREVAMQHNVPIVQRPPLARALYRTVEVGREIPEQFYKAVAEILAYVYELAEKSGSRRPAFASNG